jgi:GT2 family glycosyltransferase
MNTTLSMRDDYPSHTVVGHAPAGTPTGPAVILLNRSSRLLRREYLRDLTDQGFTEIVTVERANDAYTVESLSIEFGNVRFILVEQEFNIGEAINLAMTYIQSESVVVVWSTMGVPQGIDRAVASLREHPMRGCVAPLLRGERNEPLPTMEAPAFHRRSLRIIDLPVRGTGGKTIYPYDYVGLYNRNVFSRLNGFDPDIPHPFWQRLDFGFRVYLTGGDIPVVPAFRISYKSIPVPEDRTIDRSYARFFAKNLAVKVSAQGARIPRGEVIRFALRSRLGIGSTISVFQNARQWIAVTGRDLRMDPRDLVERWSVESE